MKSETVELVIKERCCGLWNETFKCLAFEIQVNENFKRDRTVARGRHNACGSKSLEAGERGIVAVDSSMKLGAV
jgi:hypothetical protein